MDVDLIADRTGQMLRNELLDRLHPRGGRAAAKRYTLRVDLAESLQDLAIRKDDVATRANLRLTASFSVVSLDGGTVVFSGP